MEHARAHSDDWDALLERARTRSPPRPESVPDTLVRLQLNTRPIRPVTVPIRLREFPYRGDIAFLFDVEPQSLQARAVAVPRIPMTTDDLAVVL